MNIFVNKKWFLFTLVAFLHAAIEEDDLWPECVLWLHFCTLLKENDLWPECVLYMVAFLHGA